MTLQRREKYLACIAGGLTLALAVWGYFYFGGDLSYAQLEARRERFTAELAEKKAKVRAAGAAAKRMAEWERRALPSNTSDARTVYQAWLRQLATQSKFKQLTVDSAGGRSKKGIYTLFTFSVRGQAPLAQIVEFLHGFQSAGHLHQISRLELQPVENKPELDVGLTIEALSLPGADRKSELSKPPAEAPPPERLADYIKTIVARNLFGTFQPPPDAAAGTSVTAIVASEGRGEVWLTDKASGQLWQLHENDTFQVGALQGSVKTIGAHDATFELDGKLRRFRCGDNLRGGEEVHEPPEP